MLGLLGLALWDFVGLCGTLWDFVGLCRTAIKVSDWGETYSRHRPPLHPTTMHGFRLKLSSVKYIVNCEGHCQLLIIVCQVSYGTCHVSLVMCHL